MEEPKKGTKSPHIVHVLLYSFLTAGLAVSVYLNVVGSKTATPIPAKCENFDALPDSEKSLYVQSTQYNELQKAHELLQGELSASQSALAESTQVVTDNGSPELMQEDVSRDRSVEKVKDFAQCYEMDNASYKISSKCRKNIIAYVEKHKDAKYFEIIGIVDNLEFNLFNNLQNNKSLYKRLGVDQRVIDKMKKLTRRGLSKERASEASWVIKSYTKRKAATYNANYELVSKKGQRGVIVRAYK